MMTGRKQCRGGGRVMVRTMAGVLWRWQRDGSGAAEVRRRTGDDLQPEDSGV